LQAVLNRCLPKARPDCIEKPERQVSTLVAVELGVANGSNADTGPWRFDGRYALPSGHRMKTGVLLLPTHSGLSILP
jgi:hypothetical protein